MQYAACAITIGIEISIESNSPYKLVCMAGLEDGLALLEHQTPFAIVAPMPQTRPEGDRLLQRLQKASPHSAIVLIVQPHKQEVIRYLRNLYPIDVLIQEDKLAEDLPEMLQQLWQHLTRPLLDLSPYRRGISEINRRILCVDDEEDILNFYYDTLVPKSDMALIEMAARRLRRRASTKGVDTTEATVQTPFEVVTARTSERAIRLVKEAHREGRPFAAGFFDMRLGGDMDGLDTIRAIRGIDPDMLCAVVTADTDRTVSEIQKVLQNSRSWLYFNKPFTEQELRHSANHLVEGWYQQTRRKSLDGLRQILKTLSLKRPQHMDYDRALKLVMDLCQSCAQSLLGRGSSALLMEDPQSGLLREICSDGVPPEVALSSLADQVLSEDLPLLFDARTCAPHIRAKMVAHRLRAVAGIPIRVDGALMGVWLVISQTVQDRPLKEDFEVLQQIGEVASALLTSSQLKSHRPLSTIRRLQSCPVGADLP